MAKKTVKKTIVTTTEEVVDGNKTLIVCILDRSGSMGSIIDDAIGGFNSFLKKQKKEDEEAAMTVVLFDDRYELLYNNVDLQKVKKITRDEWDPRGMTALYDAIGKAITDVEREIKDMPKSKRPDKVMVAIATDGGENASREYNSDTIKKLIKKKEKDDWHFAFLAADQDAFSVGRSFGVKGGNTFSYTNTAAGNATMFDSLSNATSKMRGVLKTSAMYSTVSNSLFEDGDVDLTVGKTTVTTDDDSTDAKDE